jgi:hypothetical protein
LDFWGDVVSPNPCLSKVRYSILCGSLLQGQRIVGEALIQKAAR